MTFEMNNSYYEIKEVSQEELQEEITAETDGYYYGQTRFRKQLILIDKDLTYERKKKTLYHELMHVYIREYISTRDIELTEEMLCDVSANAHDMIHEIVEKYFMNARCYKPFEI